MKKISCCLWLLLLFIQVKAQNLLLNGGFESFAFGFSGYMVTNAGNATGLSGQWQLAFSGNDFPACSGASCGTTFIDTSEQYTGTKSLFLNITKHTNRNDIRLFQSIATPPVGNQFVVSFSMMADKAGYPVTVNVFKSTEGITSNGACTVASPCQTFTTSTRWRQYKMYVDLSTWTVAERTNMRISIRPNTSTALPAGPYPKTFRFDDISFRVVDTLNELKDIAIQVATDRKYLAIDSGFTAEAAALQSEINQLNNSNPGWPVTPVKAIGFNPVPTQTTAATNPFIATLHAWAATYLNQSFNGFPKSTNKYQVFPNSFDGRTLGVVVENLHWLLVSPFSNYRYHPELFRRYLSIVYATSDDYKLHGYEAARIPGATDNALNDWFAAPRHCYNWWMAETSFSAYIPNLLKQRLRDATDTMGVQFYSYAVPALDSIDYSNRDVSYAEILMHAGLYRNNNTWVNFSKRIVDSMDLVNRYPDGAYSYIGKQNEVTNYHGGNNNSLAKIWAVSEYQRARDCIGKTAMYEIMSVEPRAVPEFYTAPAWKTMWNGTNGLSAEPLLAISQNPYLKTKYNEFRVITGYDDEMPLSIAFYNPNIPSLPLVDNYMVYDRNVQGPRGRYGRFSFSATGRSVAVPGSIDCGLQTVVGAMQTIPGRNANQDEMDAALMAVHSKVHVRNSSNPAEWTDWGYMMSRTNARVCVGRTASTISTPGVLQYQSSGPRAFETNWSSYQQWILLPDRMIGLVETYPTNNVPTQAMEIDGRVRFTYGRSGLLNPKYMITEQAGSRYAYGKFKAIIHQHDFTTVFTDTAGVVRDDVRNSMEIVFRYNLSTGNTLFTYPANTRKYFIVEIRDSSATGNADVTRIVNGNLKGLVVKLNGKSYASFRNDGTATSVNLSNITIPGNTNQVLFARGDSVIRLPQNITTSSYTVPANDQVLIISTNTPLIDTGRGWHNYAEMLQLNGSFPLPVKLMHFRASTSNCNTTLQWQAEQEKNVRGYEVEMSKGDHQFSSIGFVWAKCSTSNVCNYSFIAKDDDDVPNRLYRIKIMDKDGSYQYSNVLSVNNPCIKRKLIVYPNPSVATSSNFKVLYQHPEANITATLQLLNAEGRIVSSKAVNVFKGDNQFVFTEAKLAKGNYVVRLILSDQQVSAPITLF